MILQPLETKHDGRAATYPQEGVSLQPVALPRPDDGPTGEPASQLLLSIVVPLGDSRTHPIQNMTCWTEAQTRRGREYQVIAVSDGTDLAMEAAIADVLRPHDKLLRCSPDEHVLARLARGAHRADAGLLFFAEHHCIPEATCVDATIKFFERRPEVAIGVLTMKQRHGAADGDLHERWFASVEEDWARSADWIRIRTGAFAMRKHAYFALGAHDGRYGLFADEILGAKAHHAGLVVDRITESAVHHITATMKDHQHHVGDYTLGECAYRGIEQTAFCERYFGHAHVWANRLSFNPVFARSAALILIRIFLKTLWGAQGKHEFRRLSNAACELSRHLIPALLGSKSCLFFARAALRWSELRTMYFSRRSAAGWMHFHRSWQRMIHYSRMVCAIENSRAFPSADCLTPNLWPVREIPETQRIGFYGMEIMNGAVFRWTEPLMMVQVVRPVGPTRITIATVPVRNNDSHYVRAAFWDGKAISQVTTDQRGIHLSINIVSPSPHWLAIFVDRLFAPEDTRRLGIPIVSLSFAAL